MKRALFIAGDREVTRSHVAALVGSPKSSRGEWTAARAHSILEAKTLIEYGGRSFDVAVFAPQLPDGEALELIQSLYHMEEMQNVPLLLMTQRGRDLHCRRIAVADYNLSGFLELPAQSEDIRKRLNEAHQLRKILIIDPDREQATEYHHALGEAGFLPEVCPVDETPQEFAERIEPDLVALDLSSSASLILCSQLKQAQNPPKVIIYGDTYKLGTARIEDNSARADDFLEAPFSAQVLATRIAMLIGKGTPLTQTLTLQKNKLPTPSTTTAVHAPDTGVPFTTDKVQPHRRTSSIPRLTARRSNRRVPCHARLFAQAENTNYMAHALDVSRGGIFLAVHPPPEIDTYLDMRFELLPGSTPIEVRGRVVWEAQTSSPQSGAGIKFLSISDADLQRVVEYVNLLSGIIYQPD